MKIYCNKNLNRDILVKLLGKDAWVFAFMYYGGSCDLVWVKVLAAMPGDLYQVKCYFYYSKNVVDEIVYPSKEAAISQGSAFPFLEIVQPIEVLSTTEVFDKER